MAKASARKKAVKKTAAKKAPVKAMTKKASQKASSSSRVFHPTSQKQSSASPERRKHPRSTNASATAGLIDECVHCGTKLKKDDRALFVEEELARTYCSEECISEYFAPDIRKLEKEYLTRVPKTDFSGDEKEKLAHLRWVTLEDPDETWRERTLAGDFRYTLISRFEPHEGKKLFTVCICLMLRGEPSFLFLAFPTNSEALVQHFRKGEKMRSLKKTTEPNKRASPSLAKNAATDSSDISAEAPLMDGLADGWSPEESMMAQRGTARSKTDIPPSEFDEYQSCLEETLEGPSEVWSQWVNEEGQIVTAEAMGAEENDAVEMTKIYTFIRHYTDQTPEIWYVVLAKETENEDQIELIDAFPTRDPALVSGYRLGHLEVGTAPADETSVRVVH